MGKKLLTYCLIGVIGYLLIPPLSFAQPASTISVTPSIIQIDLHTDAPEAFVYYKNNTPDTIELTFSAQDFTELEDRGTLIYLQPKDAKNYKYSLSSWISFDTQALILKPGEERSLKVSIDKNKLIFGGHYASILAEIHKKTDSNQVQIHGILSSLLFVRSPAGNEIENGKIMYVQPNQTLLKFPNSFVLRFQNTGNVDVTPFGLLQITDPLGHTVGKGILNESSAIVLPESIRRFDIPVTSLPPFLFPGIYHASLMVHFGKNNTKLYANTTFFSQGSLPLIPLAILLVIIIYILIKRKKRQKQVN